MNVHLYLRFEIGLGGQLSLSFPFFFSSRTLKYSTVKMHCQRSRCVVTLEFSALCSCLTECRTWVLYAQVKPDLFFLLHVLDNIVMTLPHFNFFFVHSSSRVRQHHFFAARMVLHIIYYIIIVTVVERTARASGEIQCFLLQWLAGFLSVDLWWNKRKYIL